MLAYDIARIINPEDNLLKLKNYMETHKTKGFAIQHAASERVL